MKRFLILGLATAMLALHAGPAAAETGSKERWILGLGIGGALPTSGFGSSYGLAVAGQLTFGYAVDDNLTFLLASQSCLFQTSVLGVALTQFALVPTVKYAFGSDPFKPYATAGVGFNTAMFHSGAISISQSDLALQAGGGLQFPMDHKIDFFLEGKFTYVAAAAAYSYIPIRAGVNFDL